MDIDSLYNELNTFYKANVRKYKFLTPRFNKNHNTLSWHNHISNEKFETYNEYFEWVINNTQYSLMLEDESVVQIYFEGEALGKKKYNVIKGSMAYLPRPDKYSEYFRFDLDYKNSEDFIHTAYHIHFGYRAKDVRFTLVDFPTPSEFIRFILFIDYGHKIENFNKKHFFDSLDNIAKYNHGLKIITKK